MFVARTKYKHRASERTDAAYVFAGHGRSWSRLPPLDRQICEERALTLRDARREEIVHEIADAQASLHTALQQEAEKPKYGAMQISTCHWHQEDWEQLEALFSSEEVFNKKAIQGFRTEAIQCPAPMRVDVIAQLHAASLLRMESTPFCSTLTAEIAKNRKLFACAVIEITGEDGIRHYRFLNALLQPVHCALLPITPFTADLGLGAVDTKAQFEEASAVDSQWVWTYDWDMICTHDVLDGVDENLIKVYPHSTFTAAGFLTSSAPVWPYREYCFSGREIIEGRGVRHNDEGRAAPPTKRARTEVPAWMTALEKMGEHEPSVHATTAASVDVELDLSSTADAHTDQDDEEMALSSLLIAQIQEQKAQAGEAVSDDALYFRTHVLGGNWQMQRTARAVYGHQSVIKRPSDMHEFATQFRMKLSAAFENNRYGQHMSPLLALMWRRRMTMLYEYWRDNGRPEMLPPGCVPTLVYTHEMQTALETANEQSRRRAEDISKLLP
eukprot:5192527-Amphidinium_carterae.1